MRTADDEQEFAQHLAAALATYADPVENPAPGLLAARAIDAARVVRSRWWWAGAGLVSAMTCLLMIALVAGLHHAPRQPGIAVYRQANPTRQPQLAQVHPTPPRASFTPAATHPHARTKSPELPRLSQFPTPQPLTDQEKLMLAFVSTATPATQQLVARAVEPPLPILNAERHLPPGGSSSAENTSPAKTSPVNTSPVNTGAPHEEHR